MDKLFVINLDFRFNTKVEEYNILKTGKKTYECRGTGELRNYTCRFPVDQLNVITTFFSKESRIIASSLEKAYKLVLPEIEKKQNTLEEFITNLEERLDDDAD